VDPSNNIVHKVCCKACKASYVGQTKRQLKTRINEHSKNINYDESRHLSNYMLEKNHTFDQHNKKILDFEINYYKRLISEMIYKFNDWHSMIYKFNHEKEVQDDNSFTI